MRYINRLFTYFYLLTYILTYLLATHESFLLLTSNWQCKPTVTTVVAGNDNIHLLTSNVRQKLRVDLGDFEENVLYAEYDNFHVGTEEEQYRLLSVGAYRGTAGQCGVKTSADLFLRVKI